MRYKIKAEDQDKQLNEKNHKLKDLQKELLEMQKK